MNRFFLLRSEAIRLPILLLVALGMAAPSKSLGVESQRRSAVVQAVENASRSVVNIRGQKTVPVNSQYAGEGTKRVNGMGTGVVIDPRGYVLTNYHVVEGVRRIQVTLGDGARYFARLVAHDPTTDLAIIKIPVRVRMPVIRVGSSRDIMTGETVIAMGNAYGYEHTVTLGIVSAQHRNVQVNDVQSYRDLIQTDASINPGNSGGPLLNIDGDMIGVNVAVRQGAQGIGFAIPVDQAMRVAARLMSAERLLGVWHGVVHEDAIVANRPAVLVKEVVAGSPAFRAGLRSGDVIRQVGGKDVDRGLEFECAFIGAQAGDSIDCEVLRADVEVDLQLAVSKVPKRLPKTETAKVVVSEVDRRWNQLGLRLEQIDSEDLRRFSDKFRGGLRVVEVNAKGPAAQEGIQSGDILVGIHIWETVSRDNLDYILNDANLSELEKISFYILRNQRTYEGTFSVASLR